MTPPPSSLLQTLHTQGYIIIPSFLTPSELTTLRAAASNLTTLARAGNWPHTRTVGKQFPPWPSSPGAAGIWGIQHLLHPSLPPSSRAAFANLYFSRKILAIVQQLLQTDSPTNLVMELLNMLVRPETPFSLRWHRDDIPPETTTSEESARLCRDAPEYHHTQWNLPLYDDDSLILVPGSHRRARTEEERNADPYGELAGQVRVELKAGDVAFYDNDILHRGVYEAGKERMTLHGSVGHAEGSLARARNVLQHGVGDWVDGCDFGGVIEDEEVRRVAEGMRERLVGMGRENGDVGFSLSG